MSARTATAVGTATAATLPMTGVDGTALAIVTALGICLIVVGVLVHRSVRIDDSTGEDS